MIRVRKKLLAGGSGKSRKSQRWGAVFISRSGGGRRVEERCVRCDKDEVDVIRSGLVVAGNSKRKRQCTSAVFDRKLRYKLTVGSRYTIS